MRNQLIGLFGIVTTGFAFFYFRNKEPEKGAGVIHEIFDGRDTIYYIPENNDKKN